MEMFVSVQKIDQQMQGSPLAIHGDPAYTIHIESKFDWAQHSYDIFIMWLIIIFQIKELLLLIGQYNHLAAFEVQYSPSP